MDQFRKMKPILACLLLIMTLSGCAFPTSLFFEPPPVEQSPEEAIKPPPSPTFTVMPTDTPEPPTQQPCTYVWATKPLLDETAIFQEALQKANLGMVEVTLNAYGENCVDTLDKTVVSFAVMQTDFYFNIPVNDINNKAEMGNWTAKLLSIVKQFPPGKVPGPNTGLCGLTFETLSDSSVLSFPVDMGLRGLAAGLNGEALYSALKQP
jgi:hypothetical protein